jgi:hypothetical protein
MKIDYCTFIVNEKERETLATHLSSLISFCPDEFNVIVSTPFDWKKIRGVDDVVQYSYYKQVSQNSGLRLCGYDTARRINHIIKRCTSKWVVIAHADIFYISSLLDVTRGLMTGTNGMIGKWPHGLTIINREVYNNCHMGFWPLYGVHLAPDDNLVGVGEHVGCHIVSSPDVSELLRIEMQGFGYNCDVSNFPAGDVYRHIGGGSYAS